MTDFSPLQVSMRALFEYVEELESITRDNIYISLALRNGNFHMHLARTGMEDDCKWST